MNPPIEGGSVSVKPIRRSGAIFTAFVVGLMVWSSALAGCGSDPVRVPPDYTVMYDPIDRTKGFYWDMSGDGRYTMVVWQKDEGTQYSVGVTGTYTGSEEDTVREAFRELSESPEGNELFAPYVVFRGDRSLYIFEDSDDARAIREVITHAFETGTPDDGESTELYRSREWFVEDRR